MQIPLIGRVTKHPELSGILVSQSVAVPIFGGQPCVFGLMGYERDPQQHEYHAAIANFLAASPDVLRTADLELKYYYQDIPQPFWRWFRFSPAAKKLWQSVQFGKTVYVQRRPAGDRGIYITVDCEFGAAVEDGLYLVFKNGSSLTKLGPFDGHLTNAEAFADSAFENVVYRRVKDL